MELLSDQPVSLQWVQYRSGQSMYNGMINDWPAHLQWVQ